MILLVQSEVGFRLSGRAQKTTINVKSVVLSMDNFKAEQTHKSQMMCQRIVPIISKPMPAVGRGT